MKGVFLLVLTIAVITGCNKKQMATPVMDTVTNINAGAALTYLALGDSYTIGEALTQSQSFPYQLKDALLSQSNGVGVTDPTIVATTGWTTDNLINAIVADADIRYKTYDIVTLLIGVNDQYQGLSQANYRTKFAQVLAKAIAFAKADTSRVFVLSIPDYGVTPFGASNASTISPQIDQFNAINKDESTKAHVHYIDITPASRLAANDAALIAPDGLHPSGKQYASWVSLLVPVVRASVFK